MKARKMLTVLVLLTTSFTASARHDRDERMECLREKWTLVKTEVSSPKVCEMSAELELAEGLFTYPLINVGPLKVNYWLGSYSRKESKKETYKHEYVNICSGKVTYSSEEIFENARKRVFGVRNPNLSASIKESYKAAAMTDAEALKAYENLKVECESAL